MSKETNWWSLRRWWWKLLVLTALNTPEYLFHLVRIYPHSGWRWKCADWQPTYSRIRSILGYFYGVVLIALFIDLYNIFGYIYVRIYIHKTWDFWTRQTVEGEFCLLVIPFCIFDNKNCFRKCGDGLHRYGCTWKHVYFNILIYFIVDTTCVLILIFYSLFIDSHFY